MNKRLVIALGVWFVLILVWQAVFVKPSKPQVKKDSTVSKKVEAAKKTATKSQIITQKVSTKEKLVTINTKKFKIGINSSGSVYSLEFKEYEEDGKLIDFVEKNLKYYGNFRVLLEGLADADKQKVANFSSKKIGPLEYILQARLENGLILQKKFKFHENQYYFDIQVSLINKSGKSWKSKNDFSYQLLWGSPVIWRANKKESSMYDEMTMIFNQSSDNDIEDIDEDNVNVVNDFNWVGIKDRYFLFAMVPVNKKGDIYKRWVRSAEVNYSKDGKNNRFALTRQRETILAGESMVDNYRIFLGPKKYSVLTKDNIAKYHFESVYTGFSLIRWLSILLEKLIYFVHSFVSNFGLVIILVTLFIKIILYPLTHKSFESMKKMQVIQPKIVALKEQFKKDPKTLNQETMKLYKKEGVSPLGGCLPMLLQLPIFIALYRVIPYIVDLKNVSFLWIKDLSAPDTIFRMDFFKGIPLLPETFNVLPLIMTFFSLLQTKLSNTGKTGVTDQQKQQNKMMAYMPIIFLFIFWKMPSALVLYWTVQNVFSIIQQFYVNKKFDATGNVEVVKG